MNWQDARRRVLKSYREWLRAVRHPNRPRKCARLYAKRQQFQAPEVQQMYSLNMPVSKIRTKVRSEFEKHRYVNQLSAVDVLLFQSHSEFQVSDPSVFEEEVEVEVRC
jgi:NADH dehydrogenase (ubiquinone) 1 alpha subcomplex subunit 6